MRLWLSVIAYNLANLATISIAEDDWELVADEFAERLVIHARYYWLLLAEGHLTRKLFASMLRMIAALPVPDG